MADLNQRDAKLVQYLNEAYGKERELEMALQAHIGMTARAPYKKRLKQHLRETKSHARDVERRIKRLGGSVTTVGEAVGQFTARGKALAKGPLHMARGTSEEEKLLKNAKTEYSEEAEEIATYTAIEALAENVGDRETAKVARAIRRDEERMARYLAGLIPQLTRAVVRTEVPSDQRQTSRRRTSRRGGSRSTAGTRSRSKGRARSSASRSRSRSGSGSRSSSGSRSRSRRS
jgi:ferritin-like metal-binding protein YciE